MANVENRNRSSHSELKKQTAGAFKFLHELGTRLNENESGGFETDTHFIKICPYIKMDDNSPHYIRMQIDDLRRNLQTLFIVDKHGVIETKVVDANLQVSNPEINYSTTTPNSPIVPPQYLIILSQASRSDFSTICGVMSNTPSTFI
jgi:hypothetical protein